MEKIPHEDLHIVSLTNRHELNSFNCKSDDLNDFLKTDALVDQEDMVTKTYLCYWKEKIVGFFSILADTIEVKAIDDVDGVKGYSYPKYPGIKIARLAVDSEFERRDVGTFLIKAAIGAAMSVSDIIGCRYLMVDSKIDSIDFYKKLHFKIVEKYKKTETQKMYIDMYPIVAAMRPKETLDDF
ncbi:MAG: GNAT family N-acetyltransferase [Candidatus Methanoperedens sp.]|nr:GNAT family N-acetyltransferase [Candidatus Methanoperedens sp.]